MPRAKKALRRKKGMEYRKICDKTLIKATEAADRFNVPLSTIYTWHQMGKIEGVKLNGKSLRIFSESLFAFLESRNDRTREKALHNGESRSIREIG
jgi:excisionase family DNA binding protein